MVRLALASVIIILVVVFLAGLATGRDFGLFGETKPMIKIGGVDMVVTLARTEEERQQGLSDTESLPAMTGKLFIFEQPARYGFWMKDMNYAIDIIWIDENYKVVHIEESVSPDTFPESFKPSAPALYVLETNAGFSQQYSVRKGDMLVFSEAVFK